MRWMSKPKIRFKGYEEDWEQRKLSDITLKIGSGKTPSEERTHTLMMEFPSYVRKI